ncbi:hypothetical protein J3R83DRAFT_3060, partial [Lanmaoa asiatica]
HETFPLDCLIYGEAAERLFRVKISTKETVSDFREAIKNEKFVTFRDVEARDLDLCSIPLPDGDEHLEDEL